MTEEFSEEKLREIVERRWGHRAESKTFYTADECPYGVAWARVRGRTLYTCADATTAEEAASMVAAAVLAPDLWKLVKAVGVAVEVLEKHRSSFFVQELHNQLSAALARVNGEEEPTL